MPPSQPGDKPSVSWSWGRGGVGTEQDPSPADMCPGWSAGSASEATRGGKAGVASLPPVPSDLCPVLLKRGKSAREMGLSPGGGLAPSLVAMGTPASQTLLSQKGSLLMPTAPGSRTQSCFEQGQVVVEPSGVRGTQSESSPGS